MNLLGSIWIGWDINIALLYLLQVLCYFREYIAMYIHTAIYIYIYTYMCHHIKNDNRNCIKCKIIYFY